MVEETTQRWDVRARRGEASHGVAPVGVVVATPGEHAHPVAIPPADEPIAVGASVGRHSQPSGC